MASTTERDTRIERNNRRTRWFHAAVYLTVLALLATGCWLWLGQEGQPSVLAELTGIADADLHTYLGWALAGIAGLGVLLGWRAALTLVRDSARYRRADLSWFTRWPRAVLTGRFARHEGHFDPGQRIANLVMIVLLLALIGSGIGLVTVSGGPAFVWYSRIAAVAEREAAEPPQWRRPRHGGRRVVRRECRNGHDVFPPATGRDVGNEPLFALRFVTRH